MTKKNYIDLLESSNLTISEIIDVLDHCAIVSRTEEDGIHQTHISLSITKETSKYDGKTGVLKSDGYTVKPFITKGYTDGKETAWNFDPNCLKLTTKASRYTYILKNGKLYTSKDVKNYDNDNKTHINEVNKSAIKYLTAKKANELNIEKALNEIAIQCMMNLDNAIDKLSESDKALNIRSSELINGYVAKKMGATA